MTLSSSARAFGLLSFGSLAATALILFLLFPWAETRRDPDAIQAPAWFLALFLIMLAVVFGGTAVAAAAFSKDSR